MLFINTNTNAPARPCPPLMTMALQQHYDTTDKNIEKTFFTSTIIILILSATLSSHIQIPPAPSLPPFSPLFLLCVSFLPFLPQRCRFPVMKELTSPLTSVTISGVFSSCRCHHMTLF